MISTNYIAVSRKRWFAMGLLLTGFLASVSSLKAQPSRIYSVGLVSFGSSVSAEIKGLRQGLKDAGYIEGQNLILNVGVAKSYDGLRPIVQEYLEKKVDLIVSSGASAPLIAKQSTQHVPIVFIGGADPVQAGLVKSMARPEGNVTGIARYRDADIYGKRLEVFKEVVPSLRRLTVLYNARGENPTHLTSLKLIHKLAPQLGITLLEKPIREIADVEKALTAISNDTTDGLFPICATIFRDLNRDVAAAAIRKKIPLNSCSTLGVTDFGALLYYGADNYRLGQRGAWYVDRILKGARPQDLPVESPSYFEMVINLKTAKQIGLTIPPNMLARADRVIR